MTWIIPKEFTFAWSLWLDTVLKVQKLVLREEFTVQGDRVRKETVCVWVCVCGLCRLMSYSPASARHCVMENAIWIVFPSKLGITMLLLCRLHIAFSFTILSLSGCDHIWCDLCPVFLGRGGITFTATGWPAPRPWNEKGQVLLAETWIRSQSS